MQRTPDTAADTGEDATSSVILVHPRAENDSAMAGMPSFGPNYSTDHWLMLGGIFCFASIGGLAALLRSGQRITWKQTISALLNSGMMGLIVATILWKRFAGEDLYLLVGVSVMAGFGGSTIIDFAMRVLKEKASRFFGISPDDPKD